MLLLLFIAFLCLGCAGYLAFVRPIAQQKTPRAGFVPGMRVCTHDGKYGLVKAIIDTRIVIFLDDGNRRLLLPHQIIVLSNEHSPRP